MRRTKSGFTLIELLVVIAIIAILAAILFPVFARARDKARQAQCLSNMKQLGLAAMMYKDDYDQTYPPVASVEYRLWDGPGGNLMGPDPDNEYWAQVWGWQQVLYPYTKSMKVCFCPNSDSSAPGLRNYGANTTIIGYPRFTQQYWSWYTDSCGMSIKNDAAIVNPASKYLIMDFSMYTANYQKAYQPFKQNYVPGSKKYLDSPICSRRWYDSASGGAVTANCQADFTNARHNSGLCVAYADGHAGYQTVYKVLQEAMKRCTGVKPDCWDPSTGEQ